MARRSPTGSARSGQEQQRGRSRKRPYREGDWCAVPLSPNGFAIGVLARVSRAGTIFGYFFGPRHSSVPSLEETLGLEPGSSALAIVFSDRGLRDGRWVIMGQPGIWDRGRWPMPFFVTKDSASHEPKMLIKCSEDDPIRVLSIERITSHPGAYADLPVFQVAGHEYVEAVLSKILTSVQP